MAALSNAKAPEQEPDDVFARRAAKKDDARMRDYRDPDYARGMDALFSGAIQPPRRGRRRF